MICECCIPCPHVLNIGRPKIVLRICIQKKTRTVKETGRGGEGVKAGKRQKQEEGRLGGLQETSKEFEENEGKKISGSERRGQDLMSQYR